MPLARVLRSGVVIPVVTATALVSVTRIAVSLAERRLFASIRGPRGRRHRSWTLRTVGEHHGH
jgi:hypothetical protein